MSLTKAKGNMYSWVTHVYSPIKGCRHECSYCYTKAIPGFDNAVRLVEKELEVSLGKNKIIFVGHLCDMWGWWIKDSWILKVINHCLEYSANEYVFQSKNPGRFMDYAPHPNFLYGTTIETDQYPPGFKTQAPPPKARYAMMRGLSDLVAEQVK
jgi:DNA repair photolyase